MNFYQSAIRKHITKEIYKKPTFEVEFLGKTYQGVFKQQKKLGQTMRRYMIHGVDIGQLDQYYADTKTAMMRLERDHKKLRGDMFLQIGVINELDRHATKDLKKGPLAGEIWTQRIEQQKSLSERYGLQPSWREHMPNATILLDLKKTVEKSMLSDSGKRYVNKGTKAGLEFVEVTTKDQRKAYREIWYTMAYDKQFNVVPKETFLALMDYLYTEKKGVLFGALKDGKIVSGALYVYYGKQLVYLYGATDRSYGSIGAQYWLTYYIMDRGNKQGYTSLDLLGVAPVGGEAGHDLEGVTRFKRVFGGETVSYIGNFDLIFNNTAYKTFRYLKKGR